MLKWDSPRLVEGYTTYEDDRRRTLRYVMPRQPGFRIGEHGLPVFNFLMYRDPRRRPDGKEAGGYLVFDAEYTIPKPELEVVTAALQDVVAQEVGPEAKVEIGQLSYLRGSAHLQLLDSGGTLVERTQSPSAPSLYGSMITPFTVELSAQGAVLLEEALQGRGGVVQVIYDLWTPVRLPPVEATVWFNASKFMEFKQHVEIDWSMWGEDDYREEINEQFRSSEAGGVEIDPGTVTDQKVLDAVRDWARSALEEGVKRNLLKDIAPVPDDSRKVPDGIENLWRDISVSESSSFRHTYREGQVMEWNPQPRGTLANITSMTDRDGNPLRWEDFARRVDLDDPFLRRLNVSVRAQAPFDSLPIHSVEVKLDYGEGADRTIEEFALQDADDLGKFEPFLVGDSRTYRYSYQVNYEGESRRYESPQIETDEEQLTINVGETGIFHVNVAPGDLDFAHVTQAHVLLRYPASGTDQVEESLLLDKDHPEGHVKRVIFAPVTEPYEYNVTYTMANSKEYTVPFKESRSRQLFVNDPFSATRTISVRAFGDLTSRIDTIFLDVTYADSANDYTQTRSMALNRSTPFVDWAIPVIDDEGGTIAYSGAIRFVDGRVVDIAEETTTKNTIMVGDVPREISVLPDLIDWSRAKLVKATFRYQDEANGIDETGDLVFRQDSPAARWIHAFEDRTKTAYSVRITYFLTAGGTKDIGPLETTEQTLVLDEVPA